MLRSVLSSTTDPAKTATIVIAPSATRSGLYDARLGDGCILVTASRQPFVDAARRLLDLGYYPTAMLVLRHAGSDTECLTAQIGAAAKLRVKEDRGGPRFVRWESISRRGEALACKKAEKVAGVARGHTAQPTARPGAIAKIEYGTQSECEYSHRRADNCAIAAKCATPAITMSASGEAGTANMGDGAEK